MILVSVIIVYSLSIILSKDKDTHWFIDWIIIGVIFNS